MTSSSRAGADSGEGRRFPSSTGAEWGAESPEFTETPAGRAHDLASYFTSILQSNAAYNVLALGTGALVGPAVANWLGRDAARHGSAASIQAAQI